MSGSSSGSYKFWSRRRYYVVAIILVVIGIAWLGSWVGYRAEFYRNQELLMAIAQTQAHFVQKINLSNGHLNCDCEESNQGCSLCAEEFAVATLKTKVQPHGDFGSFGETGELVVGMRIGQTIEFLVTARSEVRAEPVLIGSGLAEPMELALNGESGVIVGKDYEGTLVMAAYHSIEGMDIGVVVKEDLSEQRNSFILGGFVASGAGVAIVLLGSLIFGIATRGLVKRAEQSEALVESAFADATTGVVITNPDGRFVRVNPAFCKMLGYSEKELLSRDFQSITHPGELASSNELAQQALAGEVESYSIEKRYIRADGEYIHAIAQATLVRDNHGKPLHFVGHVHDITERKQVEVALKLSEERFRKLYWEAPIAYQSLDSSGCILEVNETWLLALGYSTDEVIGSWFGDYLAPEFQDKFSEQFPCFKDDGSVQGVEFEMVCKDNSRFLASFDGVTVKDEEGSFLRTYCVFQNITERKQIEQELKSTQFAVDRANDAVYWIRSDARFTYVNDAACGGLGYTRSELLSMTVHDIGPEFPVGIWAEHWASLKQNGSLQFEARHQRKDGSTFQVDIVANFIEFEGEEYNCAFARDITERKQAEEALQESEANLMKAQATANLGHFSLDPETKEVIGSEELYRIFGLCQEDSPKLDDFAAVVHPADRKYDLGHIYRAIENGEHYDIEYRLLFADGTEKAVHAIGEAIIDSSGKTIRVEGIVQDITERKLAELEIQEKTHQYQVLLDAFPCIALLMKPHTREIVASNKAAKDVGALPCATCFGTWAQREEPCTFCLAPVAWETGEDQHIEVEYGGIIWDAHWIPVSDDLYMHFAFDITDSKRTAQQLRQVQKMEAIGTLAGGIAHDFNNILFAILGYAELAADDVPKENPAHESLNQIVIAGKRAAELVKQILTFSRRAEKQKSTINVASIAKETVRLLRASLPTTININLRINTAKSTIKADPTEIHQVIMNLCTNAGYAMLEHGGELEIELSGLEADELLRQQNPELNDGPHVVLRVTDTGPGIPPDVLEKMFEPFFTTKETGEGTGMGLAVVHGIILDLGGAINVYSEVGKGTSFTLYIPLVGADESPGITAENNIPRGTESVLVVDDEPVIAKMVGQTLKGLGYTATVFSNSMEALEAYLGAPDDFDLIVTDQTMDKLTGGDLAKEILAKYARQPIILCTGFSHTMPREKAEEIGITAYITKPVSKEKLAETVRKVLDRGGVAVSEVQISSTAVE